MNVAHRDWSVAMAGLFINIFIRFLFRYRKIQIHSKTFIRI